MALHNACHPSDGAAPQPPNDFGSTTAGGRRQQKVITTFRKRALMRRNVARLPPLRRAANRAKILDRYRPRIKRQ